VNKIIYAEKEERRMSQRKEIERIKVEKEEKE